MILCRALSYEENTLDKSRLKTKTVYKNASIWSNSEFAAPRQSFQVVSVEVYFQIGNVFYKVVRRNL